MQLLQAFIATIVLGSASAFPSKRQATPFTLSFSPFDTSSCQMEAAIIAHPHDAPGTQPDTMKLQEDYCANAPYTYGSFVSSVPSNQTYRLTTGEGCQLSLYTEANCGVGTGSLVNPTTLPVPNYTGCQIPDNSRVWKSVLVTCSSAPKGP